MDNRQIYEDAAIQMVAAIKKALRDKNKYATGDLERSITYRIVSRGDNYSIEILAEDYFNVVDKGRKPSLRMVDGRAYGLPPAKPIEDWMKAKGIQGNSLYGIRYNIAKYGVKGIFIIDDIVNTQTQKIANDIAEKYASTIADNLTKEITKTLPKKINISL